MKIKRSLNLIAAAFVGALAFSATPTRAADPAPRLVLQITVDQLRGDLPGRYVKQMGDGGWRYLMDHGVWYADAHHAHANTETIAGHTTLATGADPAAHGMIGNVWLDRLTGTLTYNIEDPKYHTLTPGSGVNKATEIDPTQKLATSEGRSPNAILVSTFSDELAIHTAGRAKIFGVSVKDRGAVSMAGHAGKAFWFSKASGEFVTSSYYYDRAPGRWYRRNGRNHHLPEYGLRSLRHSRLPGAIDPVMKLACLQPVLVSELLQTQSARPILRHPSRTLRTAIRPSSIALQSHAPTLPASRTSRIDGAGLPLTDG